MGYKQYYKEPEKIENYYKAKKDDFKGWHCHHRLETHTPDGKRRDVDIPQKELIALGMYYHRPPEELIFLTSREHNAYQNGKKTSDETRRKISEALSGENHPMYGKKHSDETRRKIAEAMKGKEIGNTNAKGHFVTEETKKKMGAAKKGNTYAKVNRGKHWFNNGKETKFCFECPEGFVPGRLK